MKGTSGTSSAQFRVVALTLIGAAAVPYGCTQTALEIGPPDPTAPLGTGGSGGNDGGEVGDAGLPTTANRCIATECPDPLATCPSSPYKCATDLSSDPNNCGACDHVCKDLLDPFFGLPLPPLHYVLRCLEGRCTETCADVNWRDCNGVVEDGCETNISADQQNCGACGRVCPDGLRCINSMCGCPPGLTDCDGVCVDTTNDDTNCEVCGKACQDLSGWKRKPHTKFGCVASSCGESLSTTLLPMTAADESSATAAAMLPPAPPDDYLKCYVDYFARWADCDKNFDNGCEINLNHDEDPNNCGECGRVCPEGTRCLRIGVESKPECACKSGQTLCQDGAYHYCADLSSDPGNCGACASEGIGKCPGLDPGDIGDESLITGRTICTNGRCGYQCSSGRADCNGREDDGCEVNLLNSPINCGACGHSCDVAQGQPCILGECLTVACQDEVPR